MENPELDTTARVADLIERREWREVRSMLSDLPEAEVADILLALERPHRVIAFRVLPRKLSADVFSELDTDLQNELLEDLGNNEMRQLLAAMSPDDRTHLFEELPGQATQKLLNLLSPDDLAEARFLLGYPEESVGRLMTPDYVAVRSNWSIERALEQIRRMGSISETVNTIYVTDQRWRLLDDLELRTFILADPSKTVEEIMDHTFTSISAFADREEAVQVIQRYDLEALPVVDTDGVLVGIVTVDDVLDVAQEEATEDFHKVGAVGPLKTTYREASVKDLVSRRAGWLFALIVVNLFSAGVIHHYEEVLLATSALILFMPLLIATGGNAGTQSATLIVRAIATDDVTMAQWLRVVLKELMVGIALGAIMAAAAMMLGIIRGGMLVGVVVGLSMIAIVLVANLIGAILPFILTKFGRDPAVASNPLIASVADVAGLTIYFLIATAILGSA